MYDSVQTNITHRLIHGIKLISLKERLHGAWFGELGNYSRSRFTKVHLLANLGWLTARDLGRFMTHLVHAKVMEPLSVLTVLTDSQWILGRKILPLLHYVSFYCGFLLQKMNEKNNIKRWWMASNMEYGMRIRVLPKKIKRMLSR